MCSLNLLVVLVPLLCLVGCTGAEPEPTAALPAAQDTPVEPAIEAATQEDVEATRRAERKMRRLKREAGDPWEQALTMHVFALPVAQDPTTLVEGLAEGAGLQGVSWADARCAEVTLYDDAAGSLRQDGIELEHERLFESADCSEGGRKRSKLYLRWTAEPDVARSRLDAMRALAGSEEWSWTVEMRPQGADQPDLVLVEAKLQLRSASLAEGTAAATALISREGLEVAPVCGRTLRRVHRVLRAPRKTAESGKPAKQAIGELTAYLDAAGTVVGATAGVRQRKSAKSGGNLLVDVMSGQLATDVPGMPDAARHRCD